MVIEAKPILIEPGSELDRLLGNAPTLPLRLERSGVRYRLERDDVIGAVDDLARVREAMLVADGSLNGPSGPDALGAHVRERRRPKHRPTMRHVNRRIRRRPEAGSAKEPPLAPPELLALVPGAGSWRGVVDGAALKRYIRESRRGKILHPPRW